MSANHVNKKNNLEEVARLAGVSIATVDRVLNERGSVSPKTSVKVINAARELGINRILPSPYSRRFRIKVIMPTHPQPVFQRLQKELERQIERHAKTLLIERHSIVPKKLSKLTDIFRQDHADAIIAFVPETSGAIEAITSATSSGIPVITICSDLPTTPRLAYVGIDHYRAGRAAGFFMAKMAESTRFIAICSNLSFRAEASRISGFRDELVAKLGTAFELEILEGDDLLLADCNIPCSGLYFAGWQESLTLSLQRWPDLPPVVMAHDISQDENHLLKQDKITIALDQNPEEQVSRSIAILLNKFGITEELCDSASVPFSIQNRYNI